MELDQIGSGLNTHISANSGNQEVSSNEESGISGGEQGVVHQELPPTDGGSAAWRLLIAAFVFEALFWGFPICYGVFQKYYSRLAKFQHEEDNIALIGTIAQGLPYLGAPFAAALTKQTYRYQRLQIWVGWSLCILGLLTASFSTSVPMLIVTQGITYSVGFVILTYPIISMINEWWIYRKGMAFGLISAASGATGAVMPFILEALLSRYGYQTCLRASAVAMAILTVPLMPLLKGRLPPSASYSVAPTNWNFLKKPLFWVYSFSTILSGFGFFFPSIFIPSYASYVGIQHLQGALLLAIMCIAQVIGQFAFGYLSDKGCSVSVMASSCALISMITVLTLWGMGKTLSVLIVFSSLYGFFAYGYGTMRVGMGKAVTEGDPTATFATYAIFVFMQGLGNILVGPISARLIGSDVKLHEYGISKYSHLVIFTGTAWFASALVISVWHLPRFIEIIGKIASAY